MDTDTSNPDNRSLTSYLHALRSSEPTPGGGSAAAYTGALGTSLLAMVCRLTLKSAEDHEAHPLAEVANRLDRIVDNLAEAARIDETIFGRYVDAAALPRGTESEKAARRTAIQEALVNAGRSPLLASRIALDALDTAPEVARHGTKHALSDVETAIFLLQASVAASLVNVEVNLAMIRDNETVASLGADVADVRLAADRSGQAGRTALRLRTEIHPKP